MLEEISGPMERTQVWRELAAEFGGAGQRGKPK
jgi:hypothetical protein